MGIAILVQVYESPNQTILAVASLLPIIKNCFECIYVMTEVVMQMRNSLDS